MIKIIGHIRLTILVPSFKYVSMIKYILKHCSVFHFIGILCYSPTVGYLGSFQLSITITKVAKNAQ